MFIYLFYFFLCLKPTYSSIIVQRIGIYDIQVDDMAMVFYLTVENTCDRAVHVSVSYTKCMETANSDTSDHMYLLGGDMGVIRKQSIKNLTLIYPNMYLHDRQGVCFVSVQYENDDGVTEEIRKKIYFNSEHSCQPPDKTDTSHGAEVDCTIKYSSTRSFLNKEFKLCIAVPECPPNMVYNPKSNTCRQLYSPVCKTDLAMIESGRFEKPSCVSNLVNFYCYHGVYDNKTGECDCDEGWTTSTCHEGPYHPTLNMYHMCNIEVSSWGQANSEKLVMTVLALLILALAIVAKMLLAMTILNWCCHMFKQKGKKLKATCSSYPDDIDSSEMQGKCCEREGHRVSFSQISPTEDSETDDTNFSKDKSQ